MSHRTRSLHLFAVLAVASLLCRAWLRDMAVSPLPRSSEPEFDPLNVISRSQTVQCIECWCESGGRNRSSPRHAGRCP